MRDFLWNYFSLTGAIDAYLLYKEHEALVNSSDQETQAVIAQEEADSVP
ncbi:YqzL family protein [Sulfoacidibacillus thermotolerans]|nr:YqzL family protein [Sulfoacidibacillus thermotolerans]